MGSYFTSAVKHLDETLIKTLARNVNLGDKKSSHSIKKTQKFKVRWWKVTNLWNKITKSDKQVKKKSQTCEKKSQTSE